MVRQVRHKRQGKIMTELKLLYSQRLERKDAQAGRDWALRCSSGRQELESRGPMGRHCFGSPHRAGELPHVTQVLASSLVLARSCGAGWAGFGLWDERQGAFLGKLHREGEGTRPKGTGVWVNSRAAMVLNGSST